MRFPRIAFNFDKVTFNDMDFMRFLQKNNDKNEMRVDVNPAKCSNIAIWQIIIVSYREYS